MPGYAYPVDAVAAGSANSVDILIGQSDINTATPFFVATQKTKITAALATHTGAYDTGILPVELYVYRDGDSGEYLINKTRVLKTAYLVLPIVSGDSRVGEDGDPSTIGYNKIAPEIVLQPGDGLVAICPFEDVIMLHVEMVEGVK